MREYIPTGHIPIKYTSEVRVNPQTLLHWAFLDLQSSKANLKHVLTKSDNFHWVIFSLRNACDALKLAAKAVHT